MTKIKFESSALGEPTERVWCQVSEEWRKIAEHDETRLKHFLRPRKREKEELHQRSLGFFCRNV